MNITEQLQLLKQPIIAKCIEGEKCCSKVNKDGPFNPTYVEGGELLKYYCKTYAFPTAKWRLGKCNMADHIVIEIKKDVKVRVGQQKQKSKK